jgi:hypothetical protein
MATVKIVKCETEADAKERYKLMDSDYDICLVREGSFRGEGLSAKIIRVPDAWYVIGVNKSD